MKDTDNERVLRFQSFHSASEIHSLRRLPKFPINDGKQHHPGRKAAPHPKKEGGQQHQRREGAESTTTQKRREALFQSNAVQR